MSVASSYAAVVSSASGLRLLEEGLWSSAETAPTAFTEDTHAACAALEERSFWFEHRNRCIVELVRRFPPLGPIIDVGGGNGVVTTALRAAGYDALVLEPGIGGARNALRRGLAPVIHSTLEAARLPSGSVPAIGLFDVVEHIADEAAFLSQVAGVLAPGGFVYLTVPAYPSLWSSEDVAAGHFRRYRRSSLESPLRAAGLVPEFVTYFFAPLPPAIFVARTAHRRPWSVLPPDSLHRAGGPVGRRALAAVLSLECRAIARRVSLPFGASILAVARRPPVEAGRDARPPSFDALHRW